MEFDEGLFLSLVERIVVESQTCIRFRRQGGIELKELLKETGRGTIGKCCTDIRFGMVRSP